MKKLQNSLNECAKELAISKMMVDESHFYDFRQNIFGGEMKPDFIKMFLDGDGNELVSKACAIHSSSMLGYNFFHWISKESPFTYESIEYTKVLYEVKIPVLKGSRSANMDILLTNDNNDLLFIESKFLEYLNSKPFSISDTYKYKVESYYCYGVEWSNFIKNYNIKEKGQYWDGIKQEICHLIGLTNWINGKTTINDLPSFNDAKDIKFINLVFDPSKEDYENEHRTFEKYKTLYDNLHKELEKAALIPEIIKMEFKTYSDFWPSIQKGISKELKEYLHKHYMQFADASWDNRSKTSFTP